MDFPSLYFDHTSNFAVFAIISEFYLEVLKAESQAFYILKNDSTEKESL